MQDQQTFTDAAAISVVQALVVDAIDGGTLLQSVPPPHELARLAYSIAEALAAERVHRIRCRQTRNKGALS